MYIKEKIKMDIANLETEGPITIVAFGDSVTHGAVSPGEFDYETVYWNRLRKKINEIRPDIPVNVINAGIGGKRSVNSIPRMDKQVLAHDPDLIIVCFGLNDVNLDLEEYIGALQIIFEKSLKSGAEVIFMTPNMLNTYVDENTPKKFYEYAKTTAEYQNSGRMDLYMNSAVLKAKEMGVKVCDCYSEWKELSKTQDTTKLLANRINHPTKEMHKLFADMLFDTIFGDELDKIIIEDKSMYTD